MQQGFYRIAGAAEVRELERVAMDELGIPQLLLMEHAALSVAQEIPSGAKVLILSGGGCNGADALACARILLRKGCKVDIVRDLAGRNCDEWEAQWNYLTPYIRDSKVYSFAEGTFSLSEEYDYLVDGVFGIGLNREISSELQGLFEQINESKHRPRVIAVDVPSGINATTGAVMGAALVADVTVTFSVLKTGLVLYPGRMYAGVVKTVDIGIPMGALQSDVVTLNDELSSWLPKRNPVGNKGTFGKVLIHAGSEDMPGAAVLCSRACYRSGAGLVKVVSDSSCLKLVKERVPEAVCEATEAALSDDAKHHAFSVTIAGPGIGMSDVASRRLDASMAQGTRRVLDADALNLLASRLDALTKEPQDRVERLNEWLREDTIITPHPLELSRLLAIPLKNLQDERFTTLEWLKERIHFVLVWKDACTAVIGNRTIYLNTTGNDAMATAGSGDVLAGVCGAFAAVEEDCFLAACKAVNVHGRLGDVCRATYGAYSTMASDMVDMLSEVLQ